MVRNNLHFLAELFFVSVFCFFPGIQGNIIFDSTPSSPSDSPIDVGAILNRLDLLELETDQLKKTNVKVEFEIVQLKKKNVELEQKLESILTIPVDDDGKYYGSGGQKAVATSYAGDGRYNMPRSCYEIKASNPNATTGLYFIDPDGQTNGDGAVQVHCDMTTSTTSISHDTEQKTNVTSCSAAGCYTRQIQYSATLRQMTMLADISASCQQYFKFDSLSVPLEFNSTQFGFWNDRNGAKQIFWAGPSNTKHTCQCGRETPNTCVDNQHTCNSDSLAPIQLSDEGYITATALLPVTRLNFGRTSLIGVRASYTLGRLQCTGKASVASKPENCKTLFQMGHTLSGFYLLKSGSTKVATSYCDFSKGSTEAGYETRIGNNDIISSPVQFTVKRNTAWSTPGTPMTFQVTLLNVGNAMNIETGKFKAPKAGTYSFTFSCMKEATSTYAAVSLRLNGNIVGFENLGTTAAYNSGSIHAILKLKVGDEIYLFTSGTLFAIPESNTQFTGILLEEDLVIS